MKSISIKENPIVLSSKYIDLERLKEVINTLEPPYILLLVLGSKKIKPITDILNSIRGANYILIKKNDLVCIKDNNKNPLIYLTCNPFHKDLPVLDKRPRWWNSPLIDIPYKVILSLEEEYGFFPSRKDWKVLQMFSTFKMSMFIINKNILHEIPLVPEYPSI